MSIMPGFINIYPISMMVLRFNQACLGLNIWLGQRKFRDSFKARGAWANLLGGIGQLRPVLNPPSNKMHLFFYP